MRLIIAYFPTGIAQTDIIEFKIYNLEISDFTKLTVSITLAFD